MYKGPAVNRSKVASWYQIGNDLLNEWLDEIRDKIKLKKFKKVLSPRQINILFEEYGEPDWDKERLNRKTHQE